MSYSRATKLFAKRPRPTALLALLMLCLGFISISGWVPISPNHRYFPGHEWFLAVGYWAIALFLAYCCQLGLRHKTDGESH